MAGFSSDGTLTRLLRSLIDHQEEFRALDAAAGDGDLGITVRIACEAILDALATSAANGWPDLLKEMAEIVARTSPSTFGSLISKGLGAAALAIDGEQAEPLSTLISGLEAAISTVERRGRAEPGDKTFLDALVPALEAARTASSIDDALPSIRVAAIDGTEKMIDALPKHGRGVWVGERARGIPDGGSVVVIRAFEALDATDVEPWSLPPLEDEKDNGTAPS